MNIAIDVSPLKSGHFLQHRVRGTGFYLENLKKSLLCYYPKNSYTFFTRGEKVPNNIDLAHYPYFEPFFLTLPLVRKHKTVVTVHDLTPFVFPKEFPSGLRGKLRWQIQKIALKNTDAVITDSICSKSDIVKYAGISASKIHVVYLAAGEGFKKVENTLILESIKEKYKLPEKFILYVGDATWNKNLPSLIKAIQKINVSLVMVGKALIEKNFDKSNPWNKDLLEVQMLAEKGKRVIRLGFTPQEDLIFLYNLATVFAMPSLYEGFGLPILEAMSCGCPVVTAKSGSLPEAAGTAALYVDPYNIESIAEGLGKVFFDTKTQREFAARGIEQAKKFTWKKTAGGTMNVYQRVIGSKVKVPS